MPGLAVCPQRHVWTSAAGTVADGVTVCPVCGLRGSPAAVVLTTTDANVETLAPGLVPPVVSDVKLVLPANSTPSSEPVDGALPTVPGYEILRELGRGGMGVVYLARDQELKRLVAIKMILAGAHSDAATRSRFRREAETIARLQHPGIVQIHDVGEHLGQPFLALEYVPGGNLACQIAGSTIAAETAAALAESLARTVHHAHERGIVHRDLTPRNVLLAPATSPHAIRLGGPDAEAYELKITDFGLAKVLDVHVDQTQTGLIIGTPSYMAPEQVRGKPQDIGPAADIHALGTMLYELLTGRPPFLSETRLDTLRQVVEQEPVPPSRLQSTIPRDLETICLKCLAKEPHRRYPTANDLADDLRRYLRHEPILARPASLHEQAWKWVRRHPAAAALVGVVIVSLLTVAAGGVLSHARIRSERDRAEMNFEFAMRAIDEMLTEVGEKQLAAEPRMEEKRRVLLAKALKLNRELLKQKSDDPRVRFTTAEAHRRMGDIFRLLEQHDQAIDQYETAVTLLGRLRDESPDEPGYRQQFAYVRNYQGEVLRAAGRHKDAEHAYREASRVHEELVGAFPDKRIHRQELARTLYSLGVLFHQIARPKEAERDLRKSVELLSQLVKESPQNPAYQQELARAYLNLGTVARSGSRPGEAEAAYQAAIELLRPLTAQLPHQPEYRHELGVVFNNAGNVLASAERLGEARTLHGEALGLFQTLSADFPKVPLYRQELANTWNSIGNVQSQEGSLDDALIAWRQAATILDQLVTERQDVATFHGDLGMVLGNLGLTYHLRSKLPEARLHLERAVDQLEKSLSLSPDHAIYRDSLRDSYQNLAEVSVLLGDHRPAAKAAKALASVSPDSARDRYSAACFLARCVRAAQDDVQGDPEQRQQAASTYADESIAMLREAIQKGFDDLPQLRKDQETVLQTIADRPDFRALAEELEAKTSNASDAGSVVQSNGTVPAN